MLNIVKPKAELFGLGLSNFVHILTMIRGGHLLLFKVRVKCEGHILQITVLFPS